MNDHRIVRVCYPLERGDLALRTDLDWDRDLRPIDAAEDRSWHDFEVALDGPFRYFKPVLRSDGALLWAQGDNVLAVRNGGSRLEVFPFFGADTACSACALHEVPADGSGRSHAVRLFLPPGYHENTLERFPVLYMHDGQNLFFPEEAFAGHDWRIEETLGVLTAMNRIRRVLIAGVYPVDRMADYTAPGYDAYRDYLVDVVKPWVDRDYRTRPRPEDTAVMGSSLGGVVSLHCAWSRPDVFGAAACLSSTFGYRDDLAARIASEPKRPVRLYLDSGWPGDNYEVTLDMRDLLARRGYEPGRDLVYLAFPNARHDERAWAERVHVPLQVLFGR